ncbi:MAG: adenylate/guanylate cyclase domain-containing protein [Cyclobacteriaceae bacterium]|nr:adenylate/guanylate cyclase domain-containing protein [Cyclobacteriaceae bacterium]
MRRLFYDWLFYVIMWSVVTLFYTFIVLSMMLSIIDLMNVADQIQSVPTLSYTVSNYQYVEGLLFGILFGTATFGINLAVDYTPIHKLSFGKTIIIKTLLYFLAIAVIFVLMAGIIMTSGMSPLTPEQYSEFILGLPASIYIAVGGFFIMSTLLINFIALVSKKFGPGQMFLIFLGRYKKPITENRIFMFLDLKNSTTIAEKLGHIIYSKLLQQCFLDMNKLIPKSEAEIYQYVGDEAVLTWKIKSFDLNFIKPIQLFFSFKKKLEKKAKYYKTKFGEVPEFKAGINAGVVTVAEIGDIKREIAYHGDVVNTASRLRSACNEFNKNLLASEYVIRNINQSHDYDILEIGEVNLKGKKNSIKVFSIE